MIHFKYIAKRSTGETYDGELDAADRYELYKIIKDAGGEVVSFKEHAKGGLKNINIKIPFVAGVKVQERITFARNIGAMIQAGLPASRALSVLSRQTRNKEFKKILEALNDDISKGKTLSDAMKAYPKVFSSLFISMVKAGEESGTLADAMKVVALQMDRSYALSRRVKGALMYPAVVMSAMVVVGIIMLTYVVPTLTKTFSDLNVKLPPSTLFIMSISDLLRNHGLLVLAGLILIVMGLVAWKRQPQGKKVIDFAVLRIPVIGGIIKEVNTARTARTLSSLLNSGVDMVDAVSITEDVVQNVHYKAVLKEAQEVIKKGDPISKPFSENEKLYPTFLAEMMSVGEETGKMGEMLLGVAVFYEDDVEQKTKDMSTIIEPVIMVVLAAGVGFFAVAMISPMYSLVNVIS
ncbi:MAG: type II secretion system F family protein [bacterium]